MGETQESLSAGDAGYFCELHMHPAGLAVVIMFSYMSFYLYWYIQIPHERSFKEIYAMRYTSGDAFGRLLEDHWQPGIDFTGNGTTELGRRPGVDAARETSRKDERSLVRYAIGDKTRCTCM